MPTINYIYFFYGLAFFLLGVLLVINTRPLVANSITRFFFNVGFFGLIHGIGEWYVIYRKLEMPASWHAGLNTILFGVSYLYLARASLMWFADYKFPSFNHRQQKYLIRVLLILVVVLWFIFTKNPEQEIGLRLLVGMPAALSVGLILFIYAREFRSDSNNRWQVFTIGLGFICYALLTTSGPVTGWWPFNVWNYASFQIWFGFPVQIIRSACAIVILLASLLYLNRFHLLGRKDLLEKYQRVSDDLTHFEKRYQDLFNRVSDMICILDENQNFLQVNEKTLEVLEYSRIEIEGVHICNFIHPEDRQSIKTCFEKLTNEGAYKNYVGRIISKSGRHVWVEINSIALYDSISNFAGSYDVIRDISERKEAELAMQEAHRITEAANLTKTRIMANISHELRTPLNSIIGFADLITINKAKFNLLAEGATYIKHIKSSGSLLLELIDDILEMAKLDAGMVQCHPVDFDLHETMRNMIAGFEPQFLGRKLDFKFEMDPYVPQNIRGDSRRIQQVLINLIQNAIKHTESDAIGLKITGKNLKIEDQIKPLYQLQFCVWDTGNGIGESTQTIMFEPFQRGEEPGQSKIPGAGLGLSIVRSLVELMQGELKFISRTGHGTQVELILILPEAELVLPEANQIEITTKPALRRRILVAEDNKVNQILIQKMLQELGFSMVICDGGLPALRAFQNENFDICIFDLQMPDMTGDELTLQIRQGKHNPDVPIIALTAAVSEADRERCLQVGMNAFVSKPITVALLRERLAQWV